MPPAAEDAAPASASGPQPRRRQRRSLLSRLITVLGLAFFVVELVVLAVFTSFLWWSLRHEREAHLSRWAASVQEPVRRALAAPVQSESEDSLDASVDALLRQPGKAAVDAPLHAPFTPPAGADVVVWVFLPEAEPRRFTRDGRLLGAGEVAWRGEVPPGVHAALAGDPLVTADRIELDRIVRIEPLPPSDQSEHLGGVLYLETSLVDVQQEVASIALVAFATGAVALLVTALVTLGYLRRTLLVPLARIIRADNAARRLDIERALIDEVDTPDDEVGEIIRSRNHLFQNLLQAQAERERKNAELQRQREELAQWGRELEQLVQDKTRALLRARESLHSTEKLAAVGRLAANVAHEINNPLASIAGYAEELRDELGDDHELSDSLRTIEEQAFRCKDILKRLLGLARSEGAESARFSFSEAVRRTVALSEHGARKRGVALVCELPDEGLELTSDETSLQQVVLNLVENAIDAAEQGEAPRRVEVTLLERGAEVGLAVRDSGRGIPAEVQARVFDPFYTTKPVGRGTGLGLAICQSLSEHLGGRLELESESGGTTFTLWVPRRVKSAPNDPLTGKVDGTALVEAQLRGVSGGADPEG